MPTYHLDCTDCPFDTIVEGDVGTLYDRIEDHQEEYEAGRDDHFVEVRRLAAN